MAKCGKNVVAYSATFSIKHFKHFTGIETPLSAIDFYDRAIQKKISVKDIKFKDPFLAEKKMRILQYAMQLPYSARMLGDFSYAGIKIQADFGSGNTKYTMAFRTHKDGYLFPVSVLEEDIRKSTSATSPIIAIFSKEVDDEKYNNITYMSKNINFSNLHISKEIREKISDEAYHALKPQQTEQLTPQKQVHQEKESQVSSQPDRPSSIAERIAQKQKIIQQRVPVKHTHPHRNTDQEL